MGSPLLEFSKGCSGGIRVFFLRLGVVQIGNTGSEGHISVHAFQVIEFWPAQILLELVCSKSILKGSHFKALEQHLAPQNNPEIWPS